MYVSRFEVESKRTFGVIGTPGNLFQDRLESSQLSLFQNLSRKVKSSISRIFHPHHKLRLKFFDKTKTKFSPPQISDLHSNQKTQSVSKV